MTLLKKYLLPLLFVLAIVTEAKAEKYTIPVENFTHLSIDNGYKVIYHASGDSVSRVVFDCSPELSSKIFVRSKKNTLHIQLEIDENVPRHLPTIYVYSPRLQSVTNSGDSLVVVDLKKCMDKFEAKVIGNGTIDVNNLKAKQATARISTGRGVINLNGTADNLTLSVAGTGKINAENVPALNVSASAFGPGTIICDVKDRLTLSGMSGKIFYLSTPKEIKRRGLGVKALPLDSLPQN